MGTGDREALPTGHRSPRRTFHVRFPVGKTLTVNVFRQKMNQLFQGVEDIWRAIAFSVPPIPSQGKNLNILKGDRIQCSPDSFSREKLEHTEGRDRSHLGTFHVRFAVGKRLTVNVFRQRMNQLFQGVEDIWRGIAKHSQWAIALHSLWAIALI
ncbi:hypothetical protein [Cylindrospermopsis raciborskii]|uniref:Uncharacterized protein n=1 Tax=Cylindrospermopsis raciborskii CS-505 TaxID=533240 RepID=A0A853MCY3_9CYAN|nr:hypothetical protein [Cylindrospermopsis raciborskii]OBU76402.1 hypothetical protein A9P98_08815 [Cylindrospermopsis raciborskii CS-505]